MVPFARQFLRQFPRHRELGGFHHPRCDHICGHQLPDDPAARSAGHQRHSMGMFGALNLAMRHPDIFCASLGLSPALFDENGLSDSQMFDSPKRPALSKSIAYRSPTPRSFQKHTSSPPTPGESNRRYCPSQVCYRRQCPRVSHSHKD